MSNATANKDLPRARYAMGFHSEEGEPEISSLDLSCSNELSNAVDCAFQFFPVQSRFIVYENLGQDDEKIVMNGRTGDLMRCLGNDDGYIIVDEDGLLVADENPCTCATADTPLADSEYEIAEAQTQAGGEYDGTYSLTS